MRPAKGFNLIDEGFGHVVNIQDSRIKLFKTTQVQPQDPIAPFDGAKKWFLRKGFKKFCRPKAQLTISDLIDANTTASMFLASQRGGWIPMIPQTTNGNGRAVMHYGVAWSWPTPNTDIEYLVNVTIYVQFRQFCPLNPRVN
uniref:Capsid protein n=1 Tax=Circoviridae sp. TaxID=1954248 RepID=A0A6M3YNB1_9VIRU|nr:MAG: capsid protein [Circoviridae sp.]